jgi:flavin-dependent dehydrogenase
MTMDLGDFPLTGRDLICDGVALGYGPRRSTLDKILVDAAVEAGAELREGFSVQDFATNDGRVTGIRGQDRWAASPVTEYATIIIGAGGRNSRLARFVQAPMYESAPAVACLPDERRIVRRRRGVS